MLLRRRKTDYQSEEDVLASGVIVRDRVQDYFKFVIYCLLLAVPLYAITMSIIKRDWVMGFIDALIVPVGFMHGLLMLLGIVN